MAAFLIDNGYQYQIIIAIISNSTFLIDNGYQYQIIIAIKYCISNW